jgi:NAD-dependent deacetylase
LPETVQLLVLGFTSRYLVTVPVSDISPIDLSRYRQIIVLTGAGVSVASGLPTYRGEGGIWNDIDADQFATSAAIKANPAKVWGFFAEMRARVAKVAPSGAHLALAQAESRLRPNQALTILTQNVDGLHGLAGSKAVVELHGSLRRSRCTQCDHARDEDLATSPRECPKCPRCAAEMRPDIVLFDEILPVDAEWAAKKALRECGLFIAVGTSGTVSPASSFARAADYGGARTIFVNLEPMDPPSRYFHEVYLGRAEFLLPRLLGIATGEP